MERNIVAKKLRNDLKDAIKEKDRLRVGTLRMLISALKNAEIEEREELDEEQETAVLSSYARRCRESIAEFERGGRDDLVEKERAEYAIVMQYLPEQLDEAKVREIARDVIAETGAGGPRDMGRVMGAMMQRVKGRAEGGVVKDIVLGLLKEGQGR